MKSPGIPEFVDIAKSCEKNVTYNGHIPVRCLKRFAAQQTDEGAQVEVELKFEKDEQHCNIAKVAYSTVARLTCQRCLEEMEQTVEGEVVLAFCSDESELSQLPKKYEPVLFESNEANLWQALEDELLLSLPAYPCHQDEGCNSSLEEVESQLQKAGQGKSFFCFK